jgi:hypothetical protein
LTKFEDLEAEAVYALGGIDGALGEVDGTMEDMIKVQEATFGARFQGMLRDFKSSLMPLGEILIEMGEDWIPIISKALSTAATWFKNLSEPMQKVVVIGGAIAAAIGPIIVGIGMLVSAITSIGGAVLAAGGLSAVLASIAAVITGPIGVSIAILVGLGITIAKVTKEMKKSSIESNIFGDEVSKGTQKAVGAYVDLDKKARIALNQLSFGQTAITEEIKNDMIGKTTEMGEAILAEMKKDHEARLTETTNFFAENSSLTEEEEAKALEGLKANQEAERLAIEEKTAKIKGIYEKAASENRAITEHERLSILALQNQMKTEAVTVMSESEVEQKAILERMKSQRGIINAEMAADTIKNSIASKNAIIDESTAAFIRAEENAQLMFDQGVISAEQRDKIIEDAKKVKEESIAAAETTHQKVVEEAEKQAGDHIKYVDLETGEIKTKWQVFREDTATNWSNMVEDTKKYWGDMWTSITTKTTQMNADVERKFGEMWTSITTKTTQMNTDVERKFGEIKKSITGKIEEAKTRVGELVADIKGFFTNMKLKLPSIKMPSFGIKNWSINPADWVKAMPKLTVKWNKSGGFINNAGIIGTNDGVLQGAGEGRKKEAIVPLEYKQGMMPFSNAVASTVSEQLEGLLSNDGNSGVTINISSLVVREETDIERIASELKTLMDRQRRAGGVVYYGS